LEAEEYKGVRVPLPAPPKSRARLAALCGVTVAALTLQRSAAALPAPASAAEEIGEDPPVAFEPARSERADEDRSGTLLVPLLLYTPETHLGLGGFFVHFFRLGRSDDSRLSSIAALGIATTRQQFIMEAHPDFYLFADDLHLYGKLEYQRYPDSFWGIGNAAEDAREERYDRERLRFRGSLQYRLYGPLYGGLGSDLMIYRGVYTTVDGIFATQDIPGESGGFTAGLGPTLTFDTRDNTVSPRKGYLLNASFLYFGAPLGSRYDFVKSTLDLRYYIATFPRQVLALRFHGEGHGGDVPYYQLALLGGDDLMRGYYLGRYRDEALASFELEYRYPLFWRFSGVAFAGVGAVAGALDELVGVPLRPAVGAGLRFSLNQRERLNLRLDAGVGPGTYGIYFMVGEAF
jgi:hypothetical protein